MYFEAVISELYKGIKKIIIANIRIYVLNYH